MPDFYTTLGVPKSASQEEIKKAYRRLAHQHHPDKQGGNDLKFKEINEAYQVLSDPNKRAQYDQFGSVPPGGFGSQGFGGQGRGGFDGFDFSQGFPFGNTQGEGGFGQGGQGFDAEDLFDLFGNAFGGFGRSSRAGRPQERVGGEDIRINLTLSLREAARGVAKEIELSKDVVCQECGGNGAEKGSGVIDCTVCAGKGEVRETTASFFGNITRVSVCNVCRGNGKVPKNNCHACKGEGKKHSKKSIGLDIPAGLKNGEVLVVKGEGQAGFRGTKAGDLYLQITVETDKRFKRVNNDLVYEMTVKMTDALLGARIKVPTVDGEKEIEVPAGVQNNEELKLGGLGVWGRPKGDQIIKIKIEIPKKLNSKAKKLVEELTKEI